MKTLTKSQRSALSIILASGGVADDASRNGIRVIHRGRLSPGEINRRTLDSLLRSGLVECVNGTYYATASGCKAFGAEVATSE
jgi:hypothetical protein